MIREYNGWIITTVGGFMTLKRFEARKGENWHWAFRLRDCRELCDSRDGGNPIKELYLRPLYC